ncbi:hypothetical protein ACJRO7_007489 [Eucalyptus globulus]|uniref:Defensin-like protein n=1 Tax=Eucalyptus globulus TaxID=34317 RepID=A0ABD3ILC1_EUCGL
MAKISFAQFFIGALLFSNFSMSACPLAEAQNLCSELLTFEKCNDQACVAKCKSNHGNFFTKAICAFDYFSPQIFCHCFYNC